MRRMISSFALLITCVSAVGVSLAGGIGYFSWSHHTNFSTFTILTLVLCVVLADLIGARIRRGEDRSSILIVSGPFTIALVVLGPLWVPIALAGLLATSEALQRQIMVRIAFAQTGQAVISLVAAKAVYSVLTGASFLGADSPHGWELASFMIAGASFLLTNALLVGQIFASESKRRLTSVLRENMGVQLPVTIWELATAPVVVAVLALSPVFLPCLAVPAWLSIRIARLAAEKAETSLHDQLTGLANRRLVEEHFNDHTTAHPDQNVAVLAIGIDRFGQIVEALGHDAADNLLTQVAELLSSVVRGGDRLVGRLESGVFTVIAPLELEPKLQHIELESLAERLLKTLTQQFEVAGVAIGIQATAGAALYPTHATEAKKLLQHAEAALRDAVDQNQSGTVAMFDSASEADTLKRLTMLVDLRHAIDNDQLEVWFQPKIAPRDERVVGVEALVRWRHPEKGMISPGDFISIAETTGLIKPLTDIVLNKSLAQVRRWLEGGCEIGVSVNFPSVLLTDPETERLILDALDEHGVPGWLLTIEATESSLIKQIDDVARLFRRLKEAGVKTSIDDYGTGYSSLEYLQRLDVSELKIDRSFVSHIDSPTSWHSQVCVEYVIGLGHKLKLAVVAEGVETADELRWLQSEGIDVIQGFYFCKPLPPAELDEWLSTRPTIPAPPDIMIPKPRAAREEETRCKCGQPLIGHDSLLCSYSALNRVD